MPDTTNHSRHAFDIMQNIKGLEMSARPLTRELAKGGINRKGKNDTQLAYVMKNMCVMLSLFIGDFCDLLKLCYTASSENVIEDDGVSITSTSAYFSFDGDVNSDNIKCPDLDHATQNNNEAFVDCSNLPMTVKLYKCNTPIGDGREIHKQQAKETRSVESSTQKYISQQKNVEIETPRAHEDPDEHAILKLGDTQPEGRGVQETVRMFEECDANVLKLEGNPRDENASQKTQKTSEKINTSFDDVRDRTKQQTKETNPSTDNTPKQKQRQENAELNAQRAPEVAEENRPNSLQLEHISQAGKGIQETILNAEDCDETVPKLKVNPRDVNALPESRKTSGHGDSPFDDGWEKSAQQTKETKPIKDYTHKQKQRQENAELDEQRSPEDAEENRPTPMLLEDTPQAGNCIHESVGIVEDCDAHVPKLETDACDENAPQAGLTLKISGKVDTPFDDGKGKHDIHSKERRPIEDCKYTKQRQRQKNAERNAQRALQDVERNSPFKLKDYFPERKGIQETVSNVGDCDETFQQLEANRRDVNALQESQNTSGQGDSPFEDGRAKLEQQTKGMNPIKDYTHKQKQRQENAELDAQQLPEDAEKNRPTSLQLEHIPQAGKGIQETVGIVEDSDAHVPKLEANPRAVDELQEIQWASREVDSTFDDRREKHEQQAKETLPIIMEDYTQKNNQRQENAELDAQRAVEDIGEDVSLKLKDNLQEGKDVQEMVGIVDGCDVHVGLHVMKLEANETTLKKLEETQKTPGRLLSHSILESDESAGRTSMKLEDVDINAPSGLEEAPQKGKCNDPKIEVNVSKEGVNANTIWESVEHRNDRTEEETSIKTADGDGTEFDLVLEESTVNSVDDIESFITFGCSLTSASVEDNQAAEDKDTAIQLLFEWLRGQEDVTHYYRTRNEITIHVYARHDASVASTIDVSIAAKFPLLRNICRILNSDPGVCVPCVGPTMSTYQSERGDPVLAPSDLEVIYPGREISCRPSGSDLAQTGTFSGKICGYGVTAGHIVPSGLEPARSLPMYFESQNFGSAILKVRSVHIPIRGTGNTRETLGDLSFILLNDQNAVINIFHGDPFNTGTKENFNIVLHRGTIEENDPVMVILRDENFKFGRIKSIDYNDKDTNVLNTLYVVDENEKALTTDGDSGAIIVLRPNRGDRDLRAIGIVTHLHCRLKPEFKGTNYIELNAANSISVGTIAIRLWDVLVAIQQEHHPEFGKNSLGHEPRCIKFSGPQADNQQFESGVQEDP